MALRVSAAIGSQTVWFRIVVGRNDCLYDFDYDGDLKDDCMFDCMRS